MSSECLIIGRLQNFQLKSKLFLFIRKCIHHKYRYVDMALNITDKVTDSLARELADLTGETLTHAIKIALEERLKHLRKEYLLNQRICELDSIGKRFRKNMTGQPLTDDDLYDQDGSSFNRSSSISASSKQDLRSRFRS